MRPLDPLDELFDDDDEPIQLWSYRDSKEFHDGQELRKTLRLIAVLAVVLVSVFLITDAWRETHKKVLCQSCQGALR